MAEPVQEMKGGNFNIQVLFRKKDRAGTVEKGLIVEVRHPEEEGPSAGLVQASKHDTIRAHRRNRTQS
jgi:hypothetical protein